MSNFDSHHTWFAQRLVLVTCCRQLSSRFSNSRCADHPVRAWRAPPSASMRGSPCCCPGRIHQYDCSRRSRLPRARPRCHLPIVRQARARSAIRLVSLSRQARADPPQATCSLESEGLDRHQCPRTSRLSSSVRRSWAACRKKTSVASVLRNLAGLRKATTRLQDEHRCG